MAFKFGSYEFSNYEKTFGKQLKSEAIQEGVCGNGIDQEGVNFVMVSIRLG